MKNIIYFLFIILPFAASGQQKDSVSIYRSLYLQEEAQELLKNNNTVDAVKLLLQSLDNSTEKVPNLLKEIYYNKDNKARIFYLKGSYGSVNYSTDGLYIGIIDDYNHKYNNLDVYNLETGERVIQNTDIGGDMTHLIFSPYNSNVLLYGYNKIIELDIAKNQCTSTITIDGRVKKCLYKKNGEIFVLTTDGQLMSASLLEQDLKKTNFSHDFIDDINLSDNGKRLLISYTNYFEIWDLDDIPKMINTIENTTECRISPDGKSLLVKDYKGSYSVQNAENNIKYYQLKSSFSPKYSGNGKYIYTTIYINNKWIIKVYDSKSGEFIGENPINSNEYINHDLSLCAKRISYGIAISSCYIHDYKAVEHDTDSLTTDKIIFIYKNNPLYNIKGSDCNESDYRAAYYTLLAKREYDKKNYKNARELLGYILPYNIKDSCYKPAVDLLYEIYYKTAGVTGKIKGKHIAEYSACGKYILAMTSDSTVALFNSADLSKIYEIKSYEKILGMKVSPAGKYFYVYSYRNFSIYNLEDGTLAYGSYTCPNGIYKLDFAGEDKIINYMNNGWKRNDGIEIWDIEKGTFSHIETEFIKSFSSSSDGKYLIFTDNKSYTKLINLKNNNKVQFTSEYCGSWYAKSAISADGRYFAYTTGKKSESSVRADNNIIKILSTDNNSYVCEPIQLVEDIISIDFSPSGNYICATEFQGNNRKFRTTYWKIGEKDPVFEYFTDKFYASKFSKDGNSILLYDLSGIEILNIESKSISSKVLDSIGYEVKLSPCNKYILDYNGHFIEIIELKDCSQYQSVLDMTLL